MTERDPRPKETMVERAFGFAQSIHGRRLGDHATERGGEYRVGDQSRLLFTVFDPPTVGLGSHATGTESTSHAVSVGYRDGIMFQPRWTAYVAEGLVKVELPRDWNAASNLLDLRYGKPEDHDPTQFTPRDAVEASLAQRDAEKSEHGYERGLNIPSREQVVAILAGLASPDMPMDLWMQEPSQRGGLPQTEGLVAAFKRVVEEEAVITLDETSAWTDPVTNNKYTLSTSAREGTPYYVSFERTTVLEERPKGLSPIQTEHWVYSQKGPAYRAIQRIAVPHEMLDLIAVDEDVRSAIEQNMERRRSDPDSITPSPEVAQQGLVYLQGLAS